MIAWWWWMKKAPRRRLSFAVKAQNQTAAFLWVVNSLYCCCFPALRLLCMAPFSSKIRFPFDKLANKWWGGSLWRFFIGKVFHLGGTLNQRTQKKTKFLCTRKSDEEKVDNLLLSLSLSVAGLPGNALGVLCFRRRMQFTFFSCFAFPWKIFAHFRKATPSLF